MTDDKPTRDEIERANVVLSRKPEMGARYMAQAERNLPETESMSEIVVEAGRLAEESGTGVPPAD